MNNDEGLTMGSKDLFDQASEMRAKATRVDDKAATGVMVMMVLSVVTLLGFASLQLMITVEEGAPLWQRVGATVVLAFAVAIGLLIIWFLLDMIKAGRLRQKANKLQESAQELEVSELELRLKKAAADHQRATAEQQVQAMGAQRLQEQAHLEEVELVNKAEQAKRVAQAVQDTRDELRAQQGRPSVAEQRGGTVSYDNSPQGQPKEGRNKPGGTSGGGKGH